MNFQLPLLYIIIYNTPKKHHKSVNEIITNGEENYKIKGCHRTVKLIKDKSIKIKAVLKPNVIYTVPDEGKLSIQIGN